MTRGGLRDDAAMALGACVVDLLPWRSGGVLRVTVIAKATFAFADDAAMARVDPQPIFRAEVHHGNNPTRSIRFSSDRVPYLHRGEVLFTGHAHATGSAAIEEMPVRLGVYDGARALLDKTLVVRRWGGFARLPIVYEGAFGGPGFADNPYGVGAVGTGEPEVIDPAGAGRVAGFAPIGEVWTPRRRRLGSHPAPAFQGEIADVPEGFDWSYFQAAPPDQWIDFLGGGEWIVLEGLHPTLSRARMRLPDARGMARVYGLSPFGVAEGQPLGLHADVLRIDGDEQRCTITFRGVFPVAGNDALAALRVAAGVELPGEPIAWPEALEQAALEDSAIVLSDDDIEAEPAAFDGTLSLGGQGAETFRRAPTMPFRAAAAPAPAPKVEPTLITVDLDAPTGGPALPFRPDASPTTPAEASITLNLPPRGEDTFGSTLALTRPADARLAPALPFRPEPIAAPESVPEPAPEPRPPAIVEAAPEPLPEPIVERAPEPPPEPIAVPRVEKPAPRMVSMPDPEPPAPPPPPPAPPPRPRGPDKNEELYRRFAAKKR